MDGCLDECMHVVRCMSEYMYVYAYVKVRMCFPKYVAVCVYVQAYAPQAYAPASLHVYFNLYTVCVWTCEHACICRCLCLC